MPPSFYFNFLNSLFSLFSLGTLLLLQSELCGALDITSNDGSLIANPAPLINISSPILKEAQIQCQGAAFKRSLRYRSCLDALSTFALGADDSPRRVGKRTGHAEGYLHNLPWRWISKDGSCTFDIVLRGSATVEATSGAEIARSARNLMNECVRDSDGVGGIASGIGLRGSLGIILRKHDPQFVKCWNPPEVPLQNYGVDKCDHLLGHVVADVAPIKTWGPQAGPGIDQILPTEFAASSYYSCRMIVHALFPQETDTMSYFDMWQAGVAIAGMCARFGKSGSAGFRGTRKQLIVAMDDGRSGNTGVMTSAMNQTAGAR